MSIRARPYVLAESTWKAVKDTHYQVAILPWGATEAHNYHLPYATDVIHARHVACEAARMAWDHGARVIVLPAIPFGVNTGQLDIPLTINMNPATQAAVLGDIVGSLATQGITKLVIVNGHGGNDFRQMIRELQPRFPRVLLCSVNWYQVVDADQFFLPGDHAGELETSVMLHIAPELVLPLSEAGPGTARRFRIQGFRDKWAWTPRAWMQVTDDTGIGDPHGATAAKGAEFIDLVVARIAEFLAELAAADSSQLYE
ncbi:MAG TPA: creatininase family protein [Gemmatimonadaceae bacterium]|jgi:creatinine amidohydrolase|nr:creatininase family protein [Gemmatimonadaceae bacterium]